MAPYTHPEFARWADHLSHARNGYSRPIANNTTVHWDGENAISFRFHSTDVVTLRRDGSRQLRTNGWDTATTKLRDELRKVVWPTRKELVTYTTVALVFILIMVGIVTALDYGFTRRVFVLFS